MHYFGVNYQNSVGSRVGVATMTQADSLIESDVSKLATVGIYAAICSTLKVIHGTAGLGFVRAVSWADSEQVGSC